MFEINQEPIMHKKLNKFTGSEQNLLLNYFYYDLTTEDLIEMILNRSTDREIGDLLEVLKRGD